MVEYLRHRDCSYTCANLSQALTQPSLDVWVSLILLLVVERQQQKRMKITLKESILKKQATSKFKTTNVHFPHILEIVYYSFDTFCKTSCPGITLLIVLFVCNPLFAVDNPEYGEACELFWEMKISDSKKRVKTRSKMNRNLKCPRKLITNQIVLTHFVCSCGTKKNPVQPSSTHMVFKPSL